MAKEQVEDRVATRAVESSGWIESTATKAAAAAAKEAEDAGVSPHAVMRSAADGYATGLGDRWEGRHIPADEEEAKALEAVEEPKSKSADGADEGGSKSSVRQHQKASSSKD